MREPEDRTAWYFVDEAGDPVFFDRQGNEIVGQGGCSQILLLGFVEFANPRPARLMLADLRKELLADAYLANIPSMKKTRIAFHAKDDCPEVRKAVYNLIVQLDFSAQFLVARKDANRFVRKFHGKPNRLYDHLVSQLFKNVLHRARRNRIYFSRRVPKSRQKPLEEAIDKGVRRFEQQWQTQVQTDVFVQCQTPSDEPCLQVVDYMNWAVQRAFVRGEMRYFDFVRDRISLLVDLYDTANYPNNFYDRKRNPFDAKKMSPL